MNQEWLKMTREQKLEKLLKEKEMELEVQRESYEAIIRTLEMRLARQKGAIL